MKWLSAAFISALLLIAGPIVAADFDRFNTPMAQLPEAPAASPKNAPVYNKPMYNPETKSYFELFDPDETKDTAQKNGLNWQHARDAAQTRVFHGVRGRLAVVKTKQTNDFIVKNFRPNLAWIGLRYVCSVRMLRWVTGEFWPNDAYANWYPIWNYGGAAPTPGTMRSSCNLDGAGGVSDMGVHYWGPEGQYKWNANGVAKFFVYMVIEYPTGKP